jgi:hypothetical protein
MEQPKATNMIKLAWILLSFNLIGAVVAWTMSNKDNTVMFLCGGCLWTICLLIWTRTKKDEQQ